MNRRLYTTTNQGSSWRVIARLPFVTVDNMQFLSPNVGFAYQANIYHYLYATTRGSDLAASEPPAVICSSGPDACFTEDSATVPFAPPGKWNSAFVSVSARVPMMYGRRSDVPSERERAEIHPRALAAHWNGTHWRYDAAVNLNA